MIRDNIGFEQLTLDHDYLAFFKFIEPTRRVLHKTLSYRRLRSEFVKPDYERYNPERAKMIRFLMICTIKLGTFIGNVIGFEQNFVDYLSKRRVISSDRDFKYGNYHYLKLDVSKVLNRLFNVYGCGRKLLYSNVIEITYDDLLDLL